jgi:hypothetical protein
MATSPASTTPLIVVAPTFYATKDDIRYELGLETCREAAKHQIRLILVDASSLESIQAELLQNGTATNNGQEFVRVAQQTYQGKKGAALREAISLAYEELAGKEGFIAFQEPEKTDMIRNWKDVVSFMEQSQADVCVPKRADALFKATYPIEQYHSENFANCYLDSLGSLCGLPSIDWTMGPLVFRSRYVQHWLDCKGDLWDAQLLPMIRAYRSDGAKIMSYEVDFRHPARMKQEEEGAHRWSEKRLMQLNFLFEKVGEELKEA